MPWDKRVETDQLDTSAAGKLREAQAATKAAEAALSDAQGVYEEAKAAELAAKEEADVALRGLIDASAEVGIEPHPGPIGGIPTARRSR